MSFYVTMVKILDFFLKHQEITVCAFDFIVALIKNYFNIPPEVANPCIKLLRETLLNYYDKIEGNPLAVFGAFGRWSQGRSDTEKYD